MVKEPSWLYRYFYNRRPWDTYHCPNPAALNLRGELSGVFREAPASWRGGKGSPIDLKELF